ncbi:MAG: crotonase/enoyl-CoA hydratase family protein [Cytophagales bacterium]|nr:MAG: crotonase/enoyl-CoA hydratase family protein [Cytophagales bacterium]
MSSYTTLSLHIENHIAHVRLNNPSKANAMSENFWREMPLLFQTLDQNDEVRVVVLSGEGKHFTSGIDLQMLMGLKQTLDKHTCQGRAREQLRRTILEMQHTFNAIEQCRKPVLAAIHGACIGGGIDLITACDMRYCSENAYFVVKEIEIGMVADVGTLQRLPKVIGEGITRELVYTGRKVSGKEAERIQLVNFCYENPEKMMEEVMAIAQNIANKSPLAIRGTKEMLLYTRDHSVEEGLNYIATWNAAMLFSNDLQEGVMAQFQKRPATYQD